MDISDYTVITAIGLSGFDNDIKQHIRTGWTPLGGVGVNTTLVDVPGQGTVQKTQYSQAMVKYAQK
jgi:hypothetical protein